MNEDKKCECRKSWHHKWPIKVLIIFLIIFVWVKILSGIEAMHYIGEPNGPATITVSGTGDIIATPNIATFDFTVTNESDSVADAQTKTTNTMNSITDFLKKNNVAAADIQTTDYSIYPRYEYNTVDLPNIIPNSDGTRVLAGYDVSESITVKIRNLSSAGTILSGIGEFGVTNVSGLSFTEDNADDLAKQAEQKAITDAKSNANTLAKNLGVKIIRLISYSDQSQGMVVYAKAMSVSSPAALPEISAGQNKITANVNLVYEIR